MNHLLILLLLPTLVTPSFLWNNNAPRKPVEEITVLTVPENIFRKKTLDTYTVQTSLKRSQSTYNHTNDIQDPYKGSGQTSFALLGAGHYVKIYDLDGKEKRIVSDVYVECYDTDDCSYQLTQQDIAYLSLYASFIDNSGFGPVSEEFSLGLIRGKYSQNLMGMYTEGFTQTTNHKAFWIRLWQGGKTSSGAEHLYDDLSTNVAKTVALLELAVHERSHYDVPTFSSGDGHCSSFQVNYNSLIQRTYRNLDKYEHLTTHQLRQAYIIHFPWVIFSTTIILLGIIITIIAFS